MTEWTEGSPAILQFDKITNTDEQSNPSGCCELQVYTKKKKMPASTNSTDTFSNFSPASTQNFFSFDNE